VSIGLKQNGEFTYRVRKGRKGELVASDVISEKVEK